MTWIAVDIPSYSVGDPRLVRAGLGSLTSDDGAIGSNGGNLLDFFASCWTERPGLPCCSLVPFVFFFLDNIRRLDCSGKTLLSTSYVIVR